MSFTRYLLLAMGISLMAACAPALPQLQTANTSVWLEQNWTETQRQWYHHAVQGTATLFVPHEWFMALERPELKLFGTPGLFSDNDYLLRFGFIPSPKSADNESGLPVGFAIDKEFQDPLGGKPIHALGYTCAACHTGHMTYRGTEIRIDGGPAMTDITKLSTASGVALLYTKYIPFRFNRFAKRVLGEEYNSESKKELKQQFNQVWKELKRVKSLEDSVAKDSVEEGFARLDALSRIGNQVFGVRFKAENYHPKNAPVNFPHIWSAPWFDWVQYDASIMQPIVRNAGEAMGVMAAINLTGKKETRFASTVKVQSLVDIEQLIAGEPPPTDQRAFNGLRAPKWPEKILGRIDTGKADHGKKLYTELCQGCHLPPVNSAEFWKEEHWTTPNAAGRRYLRVPEIPIDEIGTDPMQAKALADRTIDTEGMGLNTTVYARLDSKPCKAVTVTDGKAVPYGLALGAVVQETVGYWYDTHNTSPEDRERMNGYRPNCLQPAMLYKARPLNGVWATAPYLHNGSVPNLYALLSPADERPKEFYLGNQEFDPKHVGYESGEFKNGFELDTALKGNSNRGHEFNDGPKSNGVIKRLLSPEERMALIEYLKTL